MDGGAPTSAPDRGAGVVAAGIVRRIAAAARGTDSPTELLSSVGLAPGAAADGTSQFVEAEAYYGMLERAAGDDDHGLPFRYGAAFVPEDVGALGLAIKTAPTVGDALHRLARYIHVVSDTLEYELVDEGAGRAIALRGRPFHRRGAQLANECALAAVTSAVRQVAAGPLAIEAVSFRHAAPADTAPHGAYFGCPVRFGRPVDAVHLPHASLGVATRLGDEGLSAYLLGQLDELLAARDDSLVGHVLRAVTDALPDGGAPRSQVARRLGMSERTLARRLSDEGWSFQQLVDRARRDAAEALLGDGDHTLTEVAFLTGFSDQSAFQRAFKRWTGRTPTAFRAEASDR